MRVTACVSNFRQRLSTVMLCHFFRVSWFCCMLNRCHRQREVNGKSESEVKPEENRGVTTDYVAVSLGQKAQD